MTISCRVLVIGAGPTGLGAAVRLAELGEDYLVVEAKDQVGGMAGSVTDDRGYTWDLGGHVLHSHFAAFDDAILRSGAAMLDITRNGWVWIEGRLVPTPIQKQLTEMPTDLHPRRSSANLSEYYRNHFGEDLFRRFFAPYTEKMWAHPLETIDHRWTSLRSGSDASNVPAPGLARDFVPSNETFPYPVGGAGALWSAISDKMLDPNRSLLGTRVTGLDMPSRVARLDDGRHVAYEHCISTLPLTQLALWGGAEMARTSTGLVSSKVLAVGLGFTGQPPVSLADKTWLYCPDPDVPWYRATMLSNYDPGNAGPGRWNVLCETSTSRFHPRNLDDVVGRTVASLIALGADPHHLDGVWTRTIPMGYPVPTLGRDVVLRAVDETLRNFKIHSRGRFGGWRYESCNQDYSFAQGIEAVDNALFDRPENVYWHPERF